MKTEKTILFAKVFNELGEYYRKMAPVKEVTGPVYYKDEFGLEQRDFETFIVNDEFAKIENAFHVEIDRIVFNAAYIEFVDELNQMIIEYDEELVRGLLSSFFYVQGDQIIPNHRQLITAGLMDEAVLLSDYLACVEFLKSLSEPYFWPTETTGISEYKSKLRSKVEVSQSIQCEQIDMPCAQIDMPQELNTGIALEYLNKAIEEGLCDNSYCWLGTQPQLALFAEMLSEKIGLENKWKPFEILFKTSNLAQSRHRSREYVGKVRSGEIVERIFK